MPYAKNIHPNGKFLKLSVEFALSLYCYSAVPTGFSYCNYTNMIVFAYIQTRGIHLITKNMF